VHATGFLKANDTTSVPSVVALPGDQRFLKVACLQELARRVLGQDNEFGPSRFAGESTDLKAVLDELATVSMFGGRRLIVIEDADPFVTNNRAALERYVGKPAKGGVLALDVKSWPKNTRLAKLVTASGLELDCSELKGAELLKWLTETAREAHGKSLEREAATLLSELAGPDLGLLERELAKLADYAGDRRTITPADVTTLVGGWKAETTFKMLADLRAGELGAALVELDRLLRAGEAPQRILGGVLFVYRKLAAAAEAARRGTPLPAAVRAAGVFPKDQAESVEYLKRLGPKRTGRFFEYLVEADSAFRGVGRMPERIVLERLLVRLAGSAR
jgi:DNA polymerase III subunit delta